MCNNLNADGAVALQPPNEDVETVHSPLKDILICDWMLLDVKCLSFLGVIEADYASYCHIDSWFGRENAGATLAFPPPYLHLLLEWIKVLTFWAKCNLETN